MLFTNMLTKYVFAFIIKSISLHDFNIEVRSDIGISTATFFVTSLALIVLNYYWTFDLLQKVFTDKNSIGKWRSSFVK